LKSQVKVPSEIEACIQTEYVIGCRGWSARFYVIRFWALLYISFTRKSLSIKSLCRSIHEIALQWRIQTSRKTISALFL